MKRIPIALCLLLLTGCAVQKSSRPTFAVCMTGPRANDHGRVRPAFKPGCRWWNPWTDDKIDMRDWMIWQNEHEQITKRR